MKNILIIQTAFIGDVVLATSLIEELHIVLPESNIDFLVRKGNEIILKNNPNIRNILTWDKKNIKYKHLFQLIKHIRTKRYDIVINLQRFFATGLITILSGAKYKSGFKKNPLSFLFTKTCPHIIDPYIEIHEIERNFCLISDFTSKTFGQPKIYPSISDFNFIESFQKRKYLCIAPASVWFTKQFPVEKWISFISQIPEIYDIFLIGSREDTAICNLITDQSKNKHTYNLAGKLNLLQSAALMKEAAMNYVNDSAPLHIASAVDAKICVIFCSTIPEFGFGPLTDFSSIVETKENLNCRPCGLHGKKQCPEKHFKCAYGIEVDNLLEKLK